MTTSSPFVRMCVRSVFEIASPFVRTMRSVGVFGSRRRLWECVLYVALVTCVSSSPNMTRGNRSVAHRRPRSRRSPLPPLPRPALELGADPDHKNDSGSTPLMAACEQGHDFVVKWLIDQHGASVETIDLYRDTPAHAAARAGSVPLMRRLVAAGADVCRATDQYQRTPVDLARAHGHAALVDYLVSIGAPGGGSAAARSVGAAADWFPS